MDTEVLKQKYASASKSARDTLFSPSTADILWTIFEANKITEEQAIKITEDLVMTLLGVNSKFDMANRIANLDLTNDTAKGITNEINNKILMKVEEKREERKEEKPEKKDGVGESFERTLLNQARAMQPIGKAPTNLPTAPGTPSTPTPPPAPKLYQAGNDPYREALE